MISGENLDTVFIGQWEITQIDDYKSPKAGKSSVHSVVRSKVKITDDRDGVITLYSKLHSRCGEQNIVMDGTVGLYSKITERFFISEATATRVDFLWIKLIRPDQINSLKETIEEGKKYIVCAEAEMDDIVFNGDNRYTFNVKYHIDVVDKQHLLSGLELEMPIKKFNHYVHMRNLWYRDYKGSEIIYPGEF